MLYSLKVYTQDRWVRALFFFSAVLELVIWGQVFYNMRYINKELTFIIHTNILAGANWYGQWWSIYYFPGAGLLVLLMNFFIALLLFKKDPILARCLAAATVVFEALLIVLTYTIIRINT